MEPWRWNRLEELMRVLNVEGLHIRALEEMLALIEPSPGEYLQDRSAIGDADFEDDVAGIDTAVQGLELDDGTEWDLRHRSR